MSLFRLFLSPFGRISSRQFVGANLAAWFVACAMVVASGSWASWPPPAAIQNLLDLTRLSGDDQQAVVLAVTLLPCGAVGAWTSLALTIKRGHDRGFSTLYVLAVSAIPFFNIWFMVSQLLAPGEPTDNRYGPPPGKGS